MATEWSKLNVDEEWWAECVAELTPELAIRLTKLRGFLSADKMLASVSRGIGWHTRSSRWVLPCCDIEGNLSFAKGWRIPPPNSKASRWITAGRTDEKPFGRMWDLSWIVDNLDKFKHHILWVCAGEWDTIMLRSAGLAATCWTDGESSAIKADQIIAEFGDDAAKAIFSYFTKIVIVFDCDKTGKEGSWRWYNAFQAVLAKLELEIGVVAIDLSKSSGFAAGGLMPGWDISDFIKWSREAKAAGGDPMMLGPNWLLGCVSGQVDGLFDLEHIELADIMRPIDASRLNFKTCTIEELVAMGVSYALHVGSRGEGAYHMGFKASRNGWTYAEVFDAHGPELYKQVVEQHFSGKAELPLAEIIGHIKRSLMDYGNPEALTSELSNVYRLHHYFPFLMYHDGLGCWMWWSGQHWVIDQGNRKFADHCDQIAGKVSEEADEQFAIGNDKLAIELKKWAKRCQSHGVRAAMREAKDRSIFSPNKEFGEEWDKRDTMLATPEGVIDLRSPYKADGSGELALITGMEARNLYLSATTFGTLYSGSPPVGVVEARSWLEDRLLEWHSDANVTNTLQELAGWSLFGRSPQQIFVFQGPGRSGKTAFLDGLSHALGAMSGQISADALGAGSGNSRTSALARLAGKRMAIIKEVGEHGIDQETMKMLTGEQNLPARLLYQNWMDIRNQVTVFATTNHDFVESLGGNISEALKGRVVIIPWEVIFIPEDDINLAAAIVEGRAAPTELMGKELAFSISTDVKAGRVKVRRADFANIVIDGLPDDPNGAKHMADAWLQWALEGWLRCFSRGGDFMPVVADSIRSETRQHFEVVDEIDEYFMLSGLWLPSIEGTFVTGAGLLANMLRYLESRPLAGGVRVVSAESVTGAPGQRAYDSGEASLLTKLRSPTGSMLLGNALRGKRGFKGGIKRGRGQALWSSGAAQDRCWFVPYEFVGDESV